jgi:membrane protein DedA with SNARE-associated domain
METLTGLHGVTAISVICLLLFVEESGVPVPLLSGDVLLVLAGVLIVNGSVSAWQFFPPAFIAELAGVTVAHLWSRTIGLRGLELIANRVRARNALDRTTSRLSSATPLHITMARLIPGLRINTSLVAGAAGVPRSTFLLGVVPAIAIWLVAYTLLGIFVGEPVLGALNHVQHLAVTGVVLILVGVVTVIGIRYIPSSDAMDSPFVRLPRTLSVTVSAVVDIAIALMVASGTTELLRAWFSVDGVVAVSAVVAVVVLIYISVTRRMIGGTVGERVTGATYRSVEVARP